MSLQCFSNNGDFFAFCSTDMRIKVWNTKTQQLKHDIPIPNHLHKECSSLTWVSSDTSIPVCVFIPVSLLV